MVRGLPPSVVAVDKLALAADQDSSPGLTRDQVKIMARGWGRGNETPCGPGSSLKYTDAIRGWLPGLLQLYGIKVLVDAGAGDMGWISTLELPGVSYLPFDIVPRSDKVTRCDITVEPLPECDAILCRHVLNHLTVEQTLAALALMKPVTRYLLLTTAVETERKDGRSFGNFCHRNYEHEPYSLGRPEQVLSDAESTLIGVWKMK